MSYKQILVLALVTGFEVFADDEHWGLGSFDALYNFPLLVDMLVLLQTYDDLPSENYVVILSTKQHCKKKIQKLQSVLH
jgi:hypothetical protein